jgi:hypothetical protein
MEVAERIQALRAQLSAARRGESVEIGEVLERHRVVGVLGEAGVGKTEVLRSVLAARPAGTVIALDLAGAASPEHVAFHLVKQIAAASVGVDALSSAPAENIISREMRERRRTLADLLGLDGLDEAMAPWPTGSYSLVSALDALERFVDRTPIVLWIDHLEAPALTPRHPLDVDELLWAIREVTQREARLKLIVSGRSALDTELLGARAALHQLGQWNTLGRPSSDTWANLAAANGLNRQDGTRLAASTDGHPETMILGLAAAAAFSHPDIDEIVRTLAIESESLVARTLQHARTLHRLGEQILTQVARGEPPYGVAQRGSASAQEIRKVLNRLRLAGLLRRDNGWELVNPLVAGHLRDEADLRSSHTPTAH